MGNRDYTQSTWIRHYIDNNYWIKRACFWHEFTGKSWFNQAPLQLYGAIGIFQTSTFLNSHTHKKLGLVTMYKIKIINQILLAEIMISGDWNFVTKVYNEKTLSDLHLYHFFQKQLKLWMWLIFTINIQLVRLGWFYVTAYYRKSWVNYS